MRHLEDLFSILPTRVLKLLFIGLLRLAIGDEVRMAVFHELRFRQALDEDLADTGYQARPAGPTHVKYGRTVRGIA